MRKRLAGGLVAGLSVAAVVWHSRGRASEAELPCAATVLATATPPDSATPVRKVVVQNLEKQRGLATKLVRELAPDVLLAQEISLDTEEDALFPAHHVSPSGYGTAVYGRGDVRDIRAVVSPHAETGGFIYKKTTVALVDGVQYVSFHGYNGQPSKPIDKLVAHVDAVLEALRPGPTLFAGDFNTWTTAHRDAVAARLAEAGFRSEVNDLKNSE